MGRGVAWVVAFMVALPAAPARGTGASASPTAATAGDQRAGGGPVGRSFRRMEVVQVLPIPSEGTHVVLMKTSDDAPPKTGTTFLAIWVGDTEAMSIHLRLNRQHAPRPLTHDLIDGILSRFGARITRVVVEDVKEDVFLGQVFLRTRHGKEMALDARPSDSIALAIGAGAPIFVATKVLDEAGFTQEDIDRERAKGREDGPDGDTPDGGGTRNPGMMQKKEPKEGIRL